MFHAQVIYPEGNGRNGGFSANRTFTAISSGLRCRRRARCTGLSTTCVDKGEIPSPTPTCEGFVVAA
jgi:hypothetical protein